MEVYINPLSEHVLEMKARCRLLLEFIEEKKMILSDYISEFGALALYDVQPVDTSKRVGQDYDAYFSMLERKYGELVATIKLYQKEFGYLGEPKNLVKLPPGYLYEQMTKK